MNILYLCTYYHIAMLYSQQKAGLERKGDTVSVFNSTRYGSGVAEKFVQVVQDKAVVHVECWNQLDRLFFFPRQWKIERQLEKAYDLSKFDLMHAHLLVSSGYTARRMKRKYGLKYVLSVRVTDLVGFIRLPYFRRMAIKNADEASGLLFLSKSHRAEFMNKYVPENKRAEYDRKSVVIGNPLEKFWEEHTATPRKRPEKGKIRVLLIARINPVKNIPTAAEAVRVLREKGIDAVLTVIGAVEDQAEEQKLQKYDFLTQLPFMKQDQLLDIYKEHDVFLLPSRIETFGRVYIEAMSQGLPVLYSKGQGFDETYPDGEVGYSVPCDDPVYIAQRIEDAISNYERISANCIRNVSDFYQDTIIDQIERFYQSAIC